MPKHQTTFWLLLAFASMVLAQEKPSSPGTAVGTNAENAKELPSSIVVQAKPNDSQETPSLEDLMNRFEKIENSYLAFNIKSREITTFGEDLGNDAETRNPKRDVSIQLSEMSYGMPSKRNWKRSDRFTDAPPFSGIFPIAMTWPMSKRMLSQQCKWDPKSVQLDWDGPDARLKISFKNGESCWYILWLSRAHDWHPIRMQRFFNPKDDQFRDEWEVTRFNRYSGGWRVAEGIIRYRYRDVPSSFDGEIPGAGTPVSADDQIEKTREFKIEESSFGSSVNPNMSSFSSRSSVQQLPLPNSAGLFSMKNTKEKQPPKDSAKKTIKVVPLKYTKPENVIQTVEQLFRYPNITTGVVERTNSVIIRGNSTEVEQVVELIENLDTLEPNSQGASKLYQGIIAVDSQTPNESAETLNHQFKDAEKHAKDLANRHRDLVKASPTPVDLTNSLNRLTEAVSNAFILRQKLQRAELAEFRQRLERIHQSIESRDQNAIQIINRRVEELLDPNLPWESETEKPTSKNGLRE